MPGWQKCINWWFVMQVWSSPNLQNLGRACSEAIGQPHDRYQDRYTDMDRAASMDGPYKQYLPAGERHVMPAILPSPPHTADSDLGQAHMCSGALFLHSLVVFALSLEKVTSFSTFMQLELITCDVL